MKKAVLILTLGLSFSQAFSTNVQTKIKQQKVAVDTLKKAGIDPICKMKVKAGTKKTVVFEKVTYGFCSESCKKTFAADPKKYIK